MDAMLREAFPPLGEVRMMAEGRILSSSLFQEDLNTFKEMLTSLTGSKDHM